MSCSTHFLTALVLFVLAFPSVSLCLTYQTSDLQGTWHRHTLYSSQSPEWGRGMLTIDASGFATGTWQTADGDSGTDTRFLSVQGNGELLVQGLGNRFFLAPGKDLAVGVANDGGEPWLSILLRQGAPATTSDLTGTWKAFGLIVGEWQGWENGTLSVQPDGSSLWTWENSAGMSGTELNLLSIVNGEVTIPMRPSFLGHMSSNKDLIVLTGDEDGAMVLFVFIKVSGTGFTQADLAGSWVSFDLVTGAWEGWKYQTIEVDEGGNFDFISTDCEGNVANESFGPIVVTPSGAVSFMGNTLASQMSGDTSLLAMTLSKGGEHTLALMLKRGQTNYRTIRGRVTHDGTPVNAMALVNGRYMFTPADSGLYELVVPLDSQGRLTPQVFCSGFAPYRQTFTPQAEVVTHDVAMTREDRPELSVTIEAGTTSTNRARVRGAVSYNAVPVNAMVLINGQYMFTPGDTGAYDLDVPLDQQGDVTVQVYCAGKAPFRQNVTPQ